MTAVTGWLPYQVHEMDLVSPTEISARISAAGAETGMRRYNVCYAHIISYPVSVVPPLNSVLFLKIGEKRVV